MKNYIFLFGILLLNSLTSSAQDYRELIKENPAMAGANLMNYNFEKQAYTPAPKGYKSFYISHYGRHGSRYDATDEYVVYVWPIMQKADSLGLFTEAGKAFWKDLEAVFKEQDQMYGMLTTLGANEHREIAERMADNFPDVFASRSGRNKVVCQSSVVPRCIMSMTNFVHSLDRCVKGIEVQYITGDKYMKRIAYKPTVNAALVMARAKEDDVRRAVMNPMEIIEYFFNDKDKALEIIEDPFVFERKLYLASCVGHLTDYGVCLLEHFPHDILVRNFEVRNPRFYLAYGMSNEMSEYQKSVSRRLLDDFIERADQAMEEGCTKAADLRFGHDTALLPFVGHLKIEGLDNWAAFDHVNSVWNSSKSICMASNFQMIFYSDKKGNVLVKMMYNEKETIIPALKTFEGPYYRWSDLREYMIGLL